MNLLQFIHYFSMVSKEHVADYPEHENLESNND
jgi:hypothetical protein